MKDFLGNDIEVGDEVVYITNIGRIHNSLNKVVYSKRCVKAKTTKVHDSLWVTSLYCLFTGSQTPLITYLFSLVFL